MGETQPVQPSSDGNFGADGNCDAISAALSVMGNQLDDWGTA
jgi:hypothetical protein